jgi:hypothetical protein
MIIQSSFYKLIEKCHAAKRRADSNVREEFIDESDGLLIEVNLKI